MALDEAQLANLLQPISESSPCGDYIKSDKAVYRALRNQFNIAQTVLRKLAQNPTEEEKEQLETEAIANWQTVADILTEKLTTQGKDIEVVSWLLSAQTVIDASFESAAQGFLLLRTLLTEQWQYFHPCAELTADEDTQAIQHIELKTKALVPLLGESEDSSLLYLPVAFSPCIEKVTLFDLQQKERANQIASFQEENKEAIKSAKPQLQIKLDACHKILSEINKLETLFNQTAANLGARPPSFTFIKNIFTKAAATLQNISGLTPNIVREVVATATDVEAIESAAENISADVNSSEPINESAAPVAVVISNDLTAANIAKVAELNVMNRDKAFKMLREIADYFERSEPHSPISFMLEKAIKWGYMPLPELLTEMLKENQDDKLNTIFSHVGLNAGKIDLPN